MNTLALDLGFNLGWALGASFETLNIATVGLRSTSYITTHAKHAQAAAATRVYDARVISFFRMLQTCDPPPQYIVWEDITFASGGVYAVQSWASLRTCIWLYASLAQPTPKLVTVPVQTLRAFIRRYTKQHGRDVEQVTQQAMELHTPSNHFRSKILSLIGLVACFPDRFSYITARSTVKRLYLWDKVNRHKLTDDAADAAWLWLWLRDHLALEEPNGRKRKRALSESR